MKKTVSLLAAALMILSVVTLNAVESAAPTGDIVIRWTT